MHVPWTPSLNQVHGPGSSKYGLVHAITTPRNTVLHRNKIKISKWKTRIHSYVIFQFNIKIIKLSLKAPKIFGFLLALWVSNCQVCLPGALSHLPRFSNNSWHKNGSHSLACWNVINVSDSFGVFEVLITLNSFLCNCLLYNSWIACLVSSFFKQKSFKQCFEHYTAACLCWACFEANREKLKKIWLLHVSFDTFEWIQHSFSGV